MTDSNIIDFETTDSPPVIEKKEKSTGSNNPMGIKIIPPRVRGVVNNHINREIIEKNARVTQMRNRLMEEHTNNPNKLNAAALAKLQQRIDNFTEVKKALSRQKKRFSGEMQHIIAVAINYALTDLIRYGMDVALVNNKKTVKIDHVFNEMINPKTKFTEDKDGRYEYETQLRYTVNRTFTVPGSEVKDAEGKVIDRQTTEVFVRDTVAFNMLHVLPSFKIIHTEETDDEEDHDHDHGDDEDDDSDDDDENDNAVRFVNDNISFERCAYEIFRGLKNSEPRFEKLSFGGKFKKLCNSLTIEFIKTLSDIMNQDLIGRGVKTIDSGAVHRALASYIRVSSRSNDLYNTVNQEIERCMVLLHDDIQKKQSEKEPNEKQKKLKEEQEARRLENEKKKNDPEKVKARKDAEEKAARLEKLINQVLEESAGEQPPPKPVRAPRATKPKKEPVEGEEEKKTEAKKKVSPPKPKAEAKANAKASVKQITPKPKPKPKQEGKRQTK